MTELVYRVGRRGVVKNVAAAGAGTDFGIRVSPGRGPGDAVGEPLEYVGVPVGVVQQFPDRAGGFRRHRRPGFSGGFKSGGHLSPAGGELAVIRARFHGPSVHLGCDVFFGPN